MMMRRSIFTPTTASATARKGFADGALLLTASWRSSSPSLGHSWRQASLSTTFLNTSSTIGKRHLWNASARNNNTPLSAFSSGRRQTLMRLTPQNRSLTTSLTATARSSLGGKHHVSARCSSNVAGSSLVPLTSAVLLTRLPLLWKSGTIASSDPCLFFRVRQEQKRGRQWAILDEEKPVIVAVPSFWQRLKYWLYKLAGAVLLLASGWAAWAAYGQYEVCFVQPGANAPTNWEEVAKFVALVCSVPASIVVGLYSLISWGSYLTVDQWADMRDEGIGLSFSELVGKHGLSKCCNFMTRREMRDKFFRQANLHEKEPISFVANKEWDYRELTSIKLFTHKEMQQLSSLRASYRSAEAEYRADRAGVDGQLRGLLKEAEERRDKVINNAYSMFNLSAEVRLAREYQKNLEEKRAKLQKKEVTEVSSIDRLNLSPGEKQRRKDEIRAKYDKKRRKEEELYKYKHAENAIALGIKSKQRDEQVEAAHQSYEEARMHIYEQQGFAHKYAETEQKFKQSKNLLNRQWIEFCNDARRNDVDIPDSIVPPEYYS
ncbi:hypothetical protein QOT17_008190 [Balamuthia mandrillaris]